MVQVQQWISALFVRKLRDGKELPPHKDWVKNAFLPRMEKSLNRAEKVLERLGYTGSSMVEYARQLRRTRNSPVLLLGLSFAMAFAYAVVFVIVLNVTLPPTDGAYGSILILDPFVFTVMVPVGAIAGGLIYPFVLLVLRTRSWKKGISIISAMVLLELCYVTPFSVGLGFLGSFIAFGAGLFVARAFCEETPLVAATGGG